MARKYKRSSNGRFAGGGGTAGTGTKVSAGRGKPSVTASQKRVVPRKGSAAMKQSKTTTPSNQRLQRAKKVAKGVGKFVKNNPEVLGLAISAGLAARQVSALKGMTAEQNAARAFVRDAVSSKRGIGGKPGAGLKTSKRNIRGAYKIRSS